MSKEKTIKARQQEETSEVSSNSSREDVKEEAMEEAESDDDFQIPNVPNVKVQESLTDQIEYYTERAFLDRRERLENMQAADYFWSLHPANNIDFGKLFIKLKLGLLLADGCSATPYGAEEDEDMPMVLWGRNRWQILKQDLVEIRDYIVRKDATALVTGDAGQAKAVEDDDDHADRAMSHLFTKRLDVVVRAIEVNKAIAPVRASLEKQIKDEREGKPQVTNADLKELLEYIDTMEPENKSIVQELFDEGLFEEETELSTKKSASAKKRKASLGFVLINQLQHFLAEKPFELNFVQTKIENLIHKWYIEVFGDYTATLIDLRYGIPMGGEIDKMLPTPKQARRRSEEQLKSTPRSATKRTGRTDPPLSTPRRKGPPHATAQQSSDDDPFFDAKSDHDNTKQPAITQAELEELRKDRAALNTKHGNDPLAETLTAAAGAQGVARKRNHDEVNGGDEDGNIHERDSKLLEKKRSAIRLQFQDEIDEDEDDEPANVTLSDLPNRAKGKGKSPARLPPDQGIFTPTGRVERRRFWTEEETIALKEGVRTLGTGRWANIKSDHEYILRNRTSVQIKDKWRTMKKNNEI